MKSLGRILLIAVSVLYPCLVFVGLVYFKTSPRILSLCVLAIVLVNFLSATNKSGEGRRFTLKQILTTAGLTLLVIAIFVTNSSRLLKVYPIIVSVSLLATFGFTLLKPPSMILRFAKLQDKNLEQTPDFPKVERYCRTVTIIWVCFFVFNIGMATWTTLFASDLAWSLYNGLISYILIGILFVGEMIVRRFVQK